MAENNGGAGGQQGSAGASGDAGVAGKEVLEALTEIQRTLESQQGSAGLSASDQALIDALMAQEDSGVSQEDMDELELDDPKIKKALKLQEQKFKKELSALEKKAQASADANMQAQVNAQVEKEIKEAYDLYGDTLKKNWDKVQAVIDEVPALTVVQALRQVLAPDWEKRISELDAKARKENERKAGAGIGGGIDISALTSGLEVKSHAEAAETILDRILAQGGQI